jgi:hypothetical protein
MTSGISCDRGGSSAGYEACSRRLRELVSSLEVARGDPLYCRECWHDLGHLAGRLGPLRHVDPAADVARMRLAVRTSGATLVSPRRIDDAG